MSDEFRGRGQQDLAGSEFVPSEFGESVRAFGEQFHAVKEDA